MNPAEVTLSSDGLKTAGYSGNTQADCTHMMKRLCAEGWFVFGFDYQGFGNSEGQRNRHRALEQAQNCYDRFEFRNPVMSQTTYRETIAWFRQY